MFTINTLGEIRLRVPLPEPMPATPVHLTAIATDNGRPARHTSVPVTVHFPQRTGTGAAVDTTEAGWTNQANGGLLLVMVFGALLVLLALVIAVLVMYICKVKRPRIRSKVRSEYMDHEKPPLSNGPGKMDNPMFGDTRPAIATAMGGVPSDVYTATVKSIMSRNGTVRTTNPTSKLISPKIHPAPSPPRQQTDENSQNNLGDGIGRGPTWPASAMPTRVKKLSWGDDSQNKTDSGSVENVNNIDTANLDPVQRIVDNSNLTVYF